MAVAIVVDKTIWSFHVVIAFSVSVLRRASVGKRLALTAMPVVTGTPVGFIWLVPIELGLIN
jgi:hypothetical protein